MSSPLINDAPWQLEVPRQGAVVATHAPADGSSHVVTTNVEVGARRTDVTAVVVASCRYLEGLGQPSNAVGRTPVKATSVVIDNSSLST